MKTDREVEHLKKFKLPCVLVRLGCQPFRRGDFLPVVGMTFEPRIREKSSSVKGINT